MATQNEWYTVLCGTCSYILPERYQELTPIGQDAFSAVIRATDTRTGRYVVIEKILRPFYTRTHAKRTYRKLKLLICLRHPDANVIQLHDVFTPERTLDDFQTMCVFHDWYTLDKVIKRRKPFPEDHIRQIIYSIVRGLKFIHSAGVIHRIFGFDQACTASKDIQTGYVVTLFVHNLVFVSKRIKTFLIRWWRAPEVITNWGRYDEKIDLWSIGCIMAELILLRPVCQGRNNLDQLNKIFDLIGTPDINTINEVCAEESRTYLSHMRPRPRQNFDQLFGFQYDSQRIEPISGVSPQGRFRTKSDKNIFISFTFPLITGIDLLGSLLSFDPRQRPTTEEALAHPFLNQYHSLDKEPTTGHIVDEHQDVEHSVLEWKCKLFE
ncbi:unnamed protein product [Rotaria sp. Silwood2]|nr:unnamed protein product [Rotaria sp. Silwood2]